MAKKTTITPTPATDDAVDFVTASVEMMKKPDLLDRVVTRTGLKKRDVKPAVEAALAVMAETLREGTDLNLPPLGKVRVVKTKDLDGGAAVLTLKLRTPKNATVAATQSTDDI
jgi:nucleoid DNA-binding protein